MFSSYWSWCHNLWCKMMFKFPPQMSFLALVFHTEIPVKYHKLSQLLRLWYFSSSETPYSTHMRSHPVGLDVWFLVRSFVYCHTSCMRTAKALARLRGCAGSPEPSLVAYVISTVISIAGSIFFDTPNIFCNHPKIWTVWFHHMTMPHLPKDADGLANIVDPDQTALQLCLLDG